MSVKVKYLKKNIIICDNLAMQNVHTQLKIQERYFIATIKRAGACCVYYVCFHVRATTAQPTD